MGNYRVRLFNGWAANSGENNLQDMLNASFSGMDAINPASIIGGIKTFANSTTGVLFGASILHNINAPTALATPDATYNVQVETIDNDTLPNFETQINDVLTGIDDANVCSIMFNFTDNTSYTCVIGKNNPI